MGRGLWLGLVVPCFFVLTSGASEKAKQPLRWELLSRGYPRIMATSSVHVVSVRLRNSGAVMWTREDRDNFSYHWLRQDGEMVKRDGLRSRLPRSVLPGETVKLDARVKAPENAGIYLLQWEMVREKVRWYGVPEGSVPASTLVIVLPPGDAGQVLLPVITALLLLALWWLRKRGFLNAWAVALVFPVVWSWASLYVLSLFVTEQARCGTNPNVKWLNASGAALAAAMVALAPVKARRWLAPAVVTFFVVLGFADLTYLRFFGSLVPVSALLAAGQTGDVGQSIVALADAGDIWMVGSVVAAVIFAIFFRPGSVRPPGGRAVRIGAPVGWALLWFAASLPVLAAAREGVGEGVKRSKLFSHDIVIRKWGVPTTHLLDMGHTLKDWRSQGRLSSEARDRVVRFFAQRAAAAPRNGPSFGIARGMNVVLIQLESIQQWVIQLRVDGQEVTPFLNRFAEESLYFPLIFDQSEGGRTSDGEFAALNSLHPLDQGAVAFRRAGNRFHALPQVFRDSGYSTMSAHAYKRGFWNRAVLHPRYGFSTSLFREELGSGEKIGWGLADGIFLERMAGKLATLDEPFFAFLISLGLHHPFEGFPDHHKVLDVGDLEGSPLGNYLHNMHYLDRSLSEFIGALEREGLAERTVVALYGDHDSGLGSGERVLRLIGWLGRASSAGPRLDRIPFFLSIPGSGLKGQIEVVGGHTNIGPTLLHVLGLPRPASFLGWALLPGRALPTVLPGGRVAAENRLFIPSGDDSTAGRCVSISSGVTLPSSDCSALVSSAEEERTMSRLVVLHDLVPDILARPTQ